MASPCKPPKLGRVHGVPGSGAIVRRVKKIALVVFVLMCMASAAVFLVSGTSRSHIDSAISAAPLEPMVADPSVSRVNSTTLVVLGAIGVKTADAFDALVRETDKTVILSSSGGDEKSAIRMANRIREFALDVQVQGICNSACANFLFPSGKRKRVLPNSMVLLHWIGHANFDATVARSKFPKNTERLLAAHAAHRNFSTQLFAWWPLVSLIGGDELGANQLYSDLGLNPAIFSYAMAATTCSSDILVSAQLVLKRGFGNRTTWSVDYSYLGEGTETLWQPTLSDWTDAGLSGIDDFWVAPTDADADAILMNYFGKKVRLLRMPVAEMQESQICSK